MGLILDPYRFGYRAAGVVFDGTNDYLTRGGDFTTAADSKVVTCSFWMYPQGGDGSEIHILGGTSEVPSLVKNTSNKLVLTAYTVAPAITLTLTSSTSVVASDGWTHHFFAADLAAGVGYYYRNSISDLAGGATIANNTIDWSRTEWTFGARPGAVDRKVNAYLADFYLNTAAFVNPTTDIAKFIAGGKPVNLGADGSTPIGSAPVLFLKGPASGFPTNLGYGGGMTLTGSLTDAPTSPSD